MPITTFANEQRDQINNNIARRAKMKINQAKHPDSYYADCYVNSEEYKNHLKNRTSQSVAVY